MKSFIIAFIFLLCLNGCKQQDGRLAGTVWYLHTDSLKQNMLDTNTQLWITKENCSYLKEYLDAQSHNIDSASVKKYSKKQLQELQGNAVNQFNKIKAQSQTIQGLTDGKESTYAIPLPQGTYSVIFVSNHIKVKNDPCLYDGMITVASVSIKANTTTRCDATIKM